MYAVTFRFPGGYIVRGFMFNPRTRFLLWPRDQADKPIVLGVGKFFHSRSEDKGLSLASHLLRKLIEQWLDMHSDKKQKADDAETMKADLSLKLDRMITRHNRKCARSAYNSDEEYFAAEKQIDDLKARLMNFV